ncbi:MAG: hypothetical protein A2149_05885 [Candidatus Schekmanbacteria bacterium RBG_16_38_11]|uniref:NADPH-dependent FMN reductase-like domain-containing protein n=2 Tax=Candidatus Schekmaniibacteriota TaxID=1817811 RepID=A0A1F7RD59_9BACT|nr:MAG: hypothetical protein A2042_02215 [Candidatus Schekmanbacteria bacterium GWA2_38_11]OGL44295.1 MAG: hypothetical protein A2149_05885 [Candidatus Schekmanbacteria bacterium RBG_16_38_11]
MDVLGICGSARKEGNTGILVKEILDATGADCKFIWLSEANINFCHGCFRCIFEGGKCWQQDGMQNLYQDLLNAKAIVIGTPTYYEDVSGLVKNMMDRSIAINYLGIGKKSDIEYHGWKPLSGKPGAIAVTVAGAGAERAEETLAKYMGYAEIDIVGSLAVAVGMGSVNDMPEIIQKAKAIGKKLGGKIKK